MPWTKAEGKGEKNEMNFTQAMKAVKKGKFVKRPWPDFDSETHIGKDEDGLFERIGFSPPTITFDPIFTDEDYTATDWKVIPLAKFSKAYFVNLCGATV